MIKTLTNIILCCCFIILSSKPLFAQQDSSIVYLKVHLATLPFYNNNFNRVFFNTGVLLSFTGDKMEFQTGLLFDFNKYYDVNFSMGGMRSDTSRFSQRIIPLIINYHFNKKRISPFVSLGILITTTFIEGGKVGKGDIYTEDQNKILLLTGFGATYLLSKKINIYIDPYILNIFSLQNRFPSVLFGISYNFTEFENNNKN